MTHLFNVCDNVGRMHKILLLHIEWSIMAVWKEKGLCDWVANWTSHFFFYRTWYFFEEQVTDKIQWYKLRYLADIFVENEQKHTSLPGKNLNLMPMTTFELSSKKLVFETCINHSELDNLQIYKDIFDEILDTMKIYDFLIFYKWTMSSYLKIEIVQWTSIFHMSNIWFHKSCICKRSM